MAAGRRDTLAVNGGVPTRTRPWPSWPVFGEEEERELLDTLRSGTWWRVDGTRVAEFEAAFARFHDSTYGCCVTSGTAALEVSLRALGIGIGDEVILPPYTFIATASSVLAVGATPVFVDVEDGSLNIAPEQIAKAVTPRTRAVIPVHISGRPADMDRILEIARQHELVVIEDAAQAHAAEWQGRKVGSLGDAGTFSFQASKNLNAGEGGIVLTHDAQLADRVWAATHVGNGRNGGWYEHPVLGGNHRMTEWQAAILLAQIARLPEQTERRTRNAEHLTRKLAEVPGIRLLVADPRITRNAYHLFIFRYDPAAFGGRPRSELLRALQAEGVPCSGGYSPLYQAPLFEHISARKGAWRNIGGLPDYAAFADRCPICEKVCTDAVWLFQTMLLGDTSDMDDIAEALARIQHAWS